ncbi:MAG TPA: MAPEG family protein [Myxococcota bacterium]|nr:MAPEG family protein [Myxococcota bacterium]
MMPVPITALYAALQGILAIALQMPIGRLRGVANASIGDGGNPALAVAIRRHANWTEHVPFALLLLALLELNGASAGLLHGLGAGLLVARIAHPLGLDATVMRRPLRFAGALGTLLVVVVSIVALLRQAL